MIRLFVRFVLLLLLLGTILAAGGWHYAHRPLPLRQPVVEFLIERGQSMRQAADTITRAGVETEPFLLYWVARMGGKAGQIKAGSYEVREGVTPWQLITKLAAGDVSRGELLLVEGWTFRQVRAALEAHPALRQDTAGLSDEEIMQRIGAGTGAETLRPEGWFFPDTYLFDRHSSALAVLRRAYEAMQKQLAFAWAARDPSIPLTSPYEVLILASIVEKETGREEDRGLVASVFINRLRAGMRLQTDPTVIYGLGADFYGRLRRQHLEADHAWNTYTRVGLPPTPIAMPGREALMAVVQPPRTDLYYFVARGDGSSEFSRNLNEHNNAVNRYQRGGSRR